MTADRSERERVWIALSELFLDTDVSSSLDQIQREVIASPFSIEDIDIILRDEVAPVCLPNLYSVAGEWTGFDPDWLLPSIHKYLSQPAWQRRLGRSFRARGLRRMVPEWPDLRSRIIAERIG